ncbi:MAG: UDP-N-acetylmuramoyl-L-alanine--D-glutamate ligase [Thermomonas sp.]
MRISQLEDIAKAGGGVALWGWGREGRAAYHAIRSRLPTLPLTVFCNASEAEEARAFGDRWLCPGSEPSAEALARHALVVKSPGISPYCPEALGAAAQGTRFIGGTALWFAEQGDDHSLAGNVLCVTGTKGKSTTSALLAHLLRCAGKRTALAGNIGVPLLELLDERADAWVVEVSSYQTRDVAASGVRPGIAIVTNVFPEHLDWHGSEAQYVADKLALLTEAKPRIAVLNAADPRLAALLLPDSEVHWYGNAGGWHLRGDALYRGDAFVMDTTTLPLPGRHNRGNLCAVLTALEAFGLDAIALASHAADFQPLPHRLQALGECGGIAYVNDSISTTPHATLAALELYRERAVAVLVGGHDRGLPWQAFADAMGEQSPAAVITMGQNGPRIFDLLTPVAANRCFSLEQSADLPDAMAKARKALPHGGVILLSPGAPSFGAYKDYTARGRHFAELAGFDPATISGIVGMGID